MNLKSKPSHTVQNLHESVNKILCVGQLYRKLNSLSGELTWKNCITEISKWIFKINFPCQAITLHIKDVEG